MEVVSSNRFLVSSGFRVESFHSLGVKSRENYRCWSITSPCPGTTYTATTRLRRLCRTWSENRDEAHLSECSSSSRRCLVESPARDSYCSITRAFTSMVFMLRSLQSCALQMRQLMSCEADFQSLLAAAQMDMHCSFVWLFQQVFSKTPMLMISLMITLANFIAVSTSDLPLEMQIPSVEDSTKTPELRLTKTEKVVKKDTSSHEVYISGNFAAGLSGDQVVNQEEESLLVVSLLEQAAEDHKAENHGRSPHAVEVVPAASLVAPVSVQIEADNYECFDRTELMYQHALSLDRDNSLLLANYAEFLFLVRRDYERAHNLFHLALNADPEDAEIISRYAKFVWLVKGDKRAAEEAYRAAMAAEPSNPFYAGCYAHFLWHSAEDQAASRSAQRRPLE